MTLQTEDNKITACIIAGGQSKRFGQDKLFYKVNGIALIEYVINILKLVFSDIIIIANDKEKFSFLNISVFTDLIPGLGPLGGIFTALKHSTTEKTFCFAGDLPNLNAQFIKYMISVSSGHDIVVPFVNGYYEPLHSIYSKNCLMHIENTISSGNKQVLHIYDKCNVKLISQEEINKFAPPKLIFKNINYIEDL